MPRASGTAALALALIGCGSSAAPVPDAAETTVGRQSELQVTSVKVE